MTALGSINRICDAFGQVFACNEEEAGTMSNCEYILVRIIGHGSSGVVVQTQRLKDKKFFALKVIELGMLKEGDRRRAMMEVNCILNCDYFSILRCHADLVCYNPNMNGNNRDINENRNVETYVSPSSGPHGEPMFMGLILDYADAGDLRQEIKSRQRSGRLFEEHEAGMVFLQILLAIHHVHSRNMIHRDIKSANITLYCNGLVKLGDFGFSRIYESPVSQDVGYTFCGTPYYIAPELWKKKHYSKKADMFSLGVLLYEILTLVRPFRGNTSAEVMRSTLSGKYTPLPDTIAKEMRDLVYALLSEDPKDRPTTLQVLRMPLVKLLLDGFLGIIHRHPTLDIETRAIVSADVQRTRYGLYIRRPLKTIFPKMVNSHRHIYQNHINSDFISPNDTSSNALVAHIPSDSKVVTTDMYSRCVLAPERIASVEKGVTLYGKTLMKEGRLMKRDDKGNWKPRFVCIIDDIRSDHRSDSFKFGGIWEPSERAELLVTAAKETISDKCICINLCAIVDSFSVPIYDNDEVRHVFAVTLMFGAKRMLFQAESDIMKNDWIQTFQHTIGIVDIVED